MNKRRTSFFLCVVVFVFGKPAWSDPVSYQDDVHPILAERCYKCHSGDDRKGGFSMNTRESFLAGGEFGPTVELGDAGSSLLMELITSEFDDEWMPPKGERLTSEQIEILRTWIDDELVWDAEPSAHSTWKFPLHLEDIKVPRGKGLHESKHPIDRLLGRYFDEAQSAVPELVDDARYIRRVYMDTLGLLPEPDEVDQFVANTSRNKYDELVEAVLMDHRSYAEHWMTFWNDALRNDFEGTGYIDGGRKQITNWLYTSLFENKPYNEIVNELLAPKRNAEGFINGIKWRGAQTANQQIPLQAARSVSQVFLGVNLKCASCHDSFVDGWKLSDAYGLANAFSETSLELVRCDVPTGNQAMTKFLWPELGEIDASAPLPERQQQVADLVTHPDNGHFARVLVNRVWKQFMGRALVEPLESLQEKPWDPALLDWLAGDFVENEYDLLHLMRQILTSQAYRLESDNRSTFDEPYVFAGSLPRRLTTEQLYDAMSNVTGVWQVEPKFTPRRHSESRSEETVRAWRVPADPFMRSLGRPNREQITLTREVDFSSLQALELTNGGTLAAYLKHSSEMLLESGPVRPETLFKHALGRSPSSAEQVILNEYGAQVSVPTDLEDILWILFTHPEFQILF